MRKATIPALLALGLARPALAQPEAPAATTPPAAPAPQTAPATLPPAQSTTWTPPAPVRPFAQNYVTVQAEAFSSYPNLPLQGPGGVTVSWGNFQSPYFATSTRLGLTQADPSLGFALLLGAGGQFHIPLGDQFRLIPEFGLGYRLSSAGTGALLSLGLSGAYLIDHFYIGAGAETYLFAQGVAGNPVLPGNVIVQGLAGIYY